MMATFIFGDSYASTVWYFFLSVLLAFVAVCDEMYRVIEASCPAVERSIDEFSKPDGRCIVVEICCKGIAQVSDTQADGCE